MKQKNKNEKMLKTNNLQTDSQSNLLLTGMIVFANLDYNGLVDYGFKALIGGIIWMGFKLAGDYLSDRFKNQK
jgi:hypothetical protein